RWHIDGLLCIGDAAHAMSPLGGVGINLAVQDAVAAATILAEPLRQHRVTDRVLAAVRRRRAFPTAVTQAVQRFLQRGLLGPLLRIGILGAARIAPLALVNPAKGNPEVEVAAVAARDVSRGKAFAAKHGIARVHDSYVKLIGDPTLDAVYNPLPNGLHGLWTR